MLDDRTATCQLLDGRQHPAHRARLTAADVVRLARPAPARGEQCGAHAIGDERIAACLLAVAVDHDRFAPQHAANEDVIAHVRTLSRTVHGEVAQHGTRYSELGVIGERQALRCQLRGAIWRDWIERGVFVARRVATVDGRGRSVDKGPEVVVATRLE